MLKSQIPIKIASLTCNLLKNRAKKLTLLCPNMENIKTKWLHVLMDPRGIKGDNYVSTIHVQSILAPQLSTIEVLLNRLLVVTSSNKMTHETQLLIDNRKMNE